MNLEKFKESFNQFCVQDMTDVFVIHTVTDDLFLKARKDLLKLLPSEGNQVVERYKKSTDSQRSLLGEMLVRKIAGKLLSVSPDQLEFSKTEKGKPFIAGNNGVYFNVSHSGDWVAVAFGPGEVGIDIERIRQVNYRIAERYFSSEENTELNRLNEIDKLHYFFELWTLKESYLKLIGKGLTKSLGSFTIYASDSGYSIKDKSVRTNPVFFRQYSVEGGYKLAVCSRQNNFSEAVKILNFDDLLAK